MFEPKDVGRLLIALVVLGILAGMLFVGLIWLIVERS